MQKIKKLPTLPVVAQEILSLVNDDSVSVSKIENVVMNDPAIAAKILSVANSVFFGFTVRTKTLNNAIVRIGFNNVKNIALGISLMTVMQDGKNVKALDYKRLFNHSITVGFVAGVISRSLKLDFAGEIMINGMLHDLGYLVLNKYFPEIYLNVLNTFDEQTPLIEAENKVLGFTHADIGKWLAEQWKLPNTVVDTTFFHHTPSLAKRNLKRVAIIHLADYVVTGRLISPTQKDPNYPLDETSFEMLNISVNDFDEIVAEISGDEYSENVFQ